MFYGREYELHSLKTLLNKKSASMILVKGRRRIGKSTLVKEFARRNKINCYEFQGLFPRPGITMKDQLNHFSITLNKYFKTGKVFFTDWSEALLNLSKQVTGQRCVLLLDEISWLAHGDADFSAKLKVLWDTEFTKNAKLLLFLCGSVSSWIEKNIAKNTGYAGRISLDILLKELKLQECKEFLKDTNYSSLEKIHWLSITGGIPKYLEETSIKSNFHSNLVRMCFSSSGILFQEFDLIFSETFGRRQGIYKKILISLIDKPLEPAQVARKIKVPLNSDFSEYLSDLELSGFLAREYTWSFLNNKITTSRLSRLRISDNYCRFFLKYIEPYKARIIKSPFKISDSITFIKWDSILGIQCENLVKNNIDFILEQLEIPNAEVVQIGAFFQRKNTHQKGVQFDLLIQTRKNALWVGEIKSKKLISSSITTEMKEKVKNFRKPKGFSIHPFLIFSGELHENISENEFWSKIIHFE